MTINSAIVVNNLTKYYGKTRALFKLNFKIPFGTIFGLLGPNGAGKTTTVKILCSITSPSSGSAKVMDYNTSTQTKEVKMNCGFLSESPSLYEKLSAKEFLELIGELYFVPKQVIYQRMNTLLELFSLTERKDTLLNDFSRGMKQKIGLCATLIHDPKILFLDEPTANLDPSSSRIVKDLIIELVKKYDKTIFICTHLLDAAKELCDMIGIIDKGLLKFIGTPHELIDSTRARNLEDAYLTIMDPTQTKKSLSWK